VVKYIVNPKDWLVAASWQKCAIYVQQSFGIRTSGLEEKATACQMLVCYARELKDGFAAYTEDVVKIMVSHLKFYFHDGEFCQIHFIVVVL